MVWLVCLKPPILERLKCKMVVKQVEIKPKNIELLSRVREILRLFQLSTGDSINEILAKLVRILNVSLFVIDYEGKTIASKSYPSCYECSFHEQKMNSIQPCYLNGNNYTVVKKCLFNNYMCKTLKYIKSLPFYKKNDLLARFIIINFGEPLAQENILLVEIAAIFLNNIFALTLLKEKNETKRDERKLQFALNNLSYSEEKIVFDILRNFEVNQSSQNINITALAEQKGISAPAITRTLKLLQSAGIIRHRSLGSRGSIIWITNSYLLKNLNTVIKKLA